MMKLFLTIVTIFFIAACNVNTDTIDKAWHKDVKRVGMVVKLKTETTDPMQEGIVPGQQGWKMMERIYYNY